MKAKDIAQHFADVATWVDPERTVDGIIVGDWEKDISRVLVTWISSVDAVKDAVSRGVDMLVTHEPTFYVHRHERDYVENWEIARAKKRLIEDNGLVVLRNHDCWDRMPRIGIPWAWAQHLELGDTPAAISEDSSQHRYDIEPIALDELAKRVAAKTASAGEPLVQVAGDGGKLVSKVGIGTGCGCGIDTYWRLGCDVSIVCDDGTNWWGELQRAIDADHPVIRVNHGSSEDPGMVTLTAYINDNLPGVSAEHRPFKGFYRLVGG